MSTKIFVGNLPMDVRRGELEKLFGAYGRIVDISIKNPPRPPAFAFVEFEDTRDAEDACREKNNSQLDGNILRVELSRGRGRERESRPRNNRSEFRVRLSNLPQTISWQDLKDIMRDFGEVIYTEVDRRGGGVAEFSNRSDMNYCIEKLDDTNIQGSYVRVSRENAGRGGRSRSPPPRRRSPGRGGYGGRGGRGGPPRGGHRGRSHSRSAPRNGGDRRDQARRSRSPPRGPRDGGNAGARRSRSPPRGPRGSPDKRRPSPDRRAPSEERRPSPERRRSPPRGERERSPEARRSPEQRDARPAEEKDGDAN